MPTSVSHGMPGARLAAKQRGVEPRAGADRRLGCPRRGRSPRALSRRPAMVDAGGMREPPSKTSYLFDRGQADQERLSRSSEALSAFTSGGCLRAGLRRGGRAIDIGCGPLGALIALAELVGPEGRVAGLDSSGEALALAHAILTQRGYTTLTLVQGELDTVLTAQLCPPGPFDLAYVRFLVHQRDPADSLWRIVRLLRPGGRISLTRFRRAVATLPSPRACLPSSAWTSSYMPESRPAGVRVMRHTTTRSSVDALACAFSVSAASCRRLSPWCFWRRSKQCCARLGQA